MTPALKAMVEAMIAEGQAIDDENAAAEAINPNHGLCGCSGPHPACPCAVRTMTRIARAGLEAIKDGPIEVINAMVPEVQKAAMEFVRRERAGSSASMNGALDYAEFGAWRAALAAMLKEQP